MNEGVCQLQYRTDLWIIFQVVEARFSDQPAIVTAMMKKFATFETIADFAPMVTSPTGGEYQLPLVVSLRRVFEIYIKFRSKLLKSVILKLSKKHNARNS